MVMTPEDQIDALDHFSQFAIVVLHHMSEGDDHIAFLLIFEFFNHFLGKFDKGQIHADFLIVGVKSVNPLLFSQTEYTNLHSVFLHNVSLKPLS